MDLKKHSNSRTIVFPLACPHSLNDRLCTNIYKVHSVTQFIQNYIKPFIDYIEKYDVAKKMKFNCTVKTVTEKDDG